MTRDVKKTDPFLEQINKHYRGLLTRLDSINEESLRELLQKISDATFKLNDDPEILESEDFIRGVIKSELREHLESRKEEILAERREERLMLAQARSEARQEERREAEDDPYALEHDYGGDDEDDRSDGGDDGSEFREPEYDDDYDADCDDEFDDRSEDEDDESHSLHESEFGDLSDLGNLIAISTNFGESDLSWLINQIAEYDDEELWENLIQKILKDEDVANSIDPDLLNFIFYSASVTDSDDEFIRAINSGSLARNYDDKKLVDGGFITDSVIKYLSDLSIENLRKSVEREFVDAKEIAKNGDLREFRRDYNAAYSRHDLVTQNQLWSIFDLLQKKSKSAKRDGDLNILETLEEAKKLYRERAGAYYFRTYPAHSTNKLVYSSKKEEKVAAIDIVELLGELEEVGRIVGQTLKTTLKKPEEDATNILAPILCFVVTDKAHRKDGDHRRIIVPLSLVLPDYEHFLLSKDISDEVFTEEDLERFYELAKTDSDHGIKLIKDKTPSAKQDAEHVAPKALSKIFDHSERVLFHALRKNENVKTIVASLKTELEKISGKELEGKYKVYAAALLTYSTHGVCQYCSPTIIAHENHLRNTFLTALTEELNSSENFKTRGSQGGGSREKRQDRIKEKFHLSTIVTCDDTHSEQSIDMSDASLTTAQKKLETKYHNPQSKIYLDHDAIDLHRHEITDTKKGRPEKKQHSFYEFVGAKFSEKEKPSHDAECVEFRFSGKTFMSGSKAWKLKDVSDGAHELNESAMTVISARSVIKVTSLTDKANFVTH